MPKRGWTQTTAGVTLGIVLASSLSMGAYLRVGSVNAIATVGGTIVMIVLGALAIRGMNWSKWVLVACFGCLALAGLGTLLYSHLDTTEVVTAVSFVLGFAAATLILVRAPDTGV